MECWQYGHCWASSWISRLQYGHGTVGSPSSSSSSGWYSSSSADQSDPSSSQSAASSGSQVGIVYPAARCMTVAPFNLFPPPPLARRLLYIFPVTIVLYGDSIMASKNTDRP